MEALTSHRTTQHVVNDMLPWQCEESVLPQGANGCHKGNHPKRNETKRNPKVHTVTTTICLITPTRHVWQKKPHDEKVR